MTYEERMRVNAEDLYDKAKEMEAGSDEQAKAISTANSIVDRLNETKKIKNDRTDRWIKFGWTAAAFLASLGLSAWSHYDSKRIEMQGYTPTTEAGRSSLRGILSFFDRQKF